MTKIDRIEVDGKAGMYILEACEGIKGIKRNNGSFKCSFCNEIITENNFGGIIPNPTRIMCKHILCIMQYVKENAKSIKINDVNKHEIKN